MTKSRLAGLPALILVFSASPTLSADPASDQFFESQVRPLLVERCLKCHGAEGKPKGGLRLDSRAAILSGGDGGPAAVVGKPDESPIVQAVRYLDEPRMPPAGKLPDREIAAIARWVEIGLPWPDSAPAPGNSAPGIDEKAIKSADFWSFRSIRAVEPPIVEDADWTRNEIDRFLLNGMSSRGLKPAPEADKRTWVRRVSFDLVGLPPTPRDVDAFLKDDSADAFARVVDRLLASPRYGERWGRHWLDLVRYADSLDARGVGGEGDIREAWRYRDWVIDAFNSDMPYDRFVTDQVAGDLLPGPDPSADPDEQFNERGTIASTMLAIGNWGNGDADKEKILTDIADDQVDVVSRTFLGLTVACARCHDHKFDPISQADYYGLAGIFFSTHILDRLAGKGDGEKIRGAPLASRAELRRRESYKARVAEAESAVKSARSRGYGRLAASLRPQASRYIVSARDFLQAADPSRRPSIDEFARSRGLLPFALKNWVDRLRPDEFRPLNAATKDKIGTGVHAWERDNDLPSAVANTTDREVSFVTFRLPPRSVSVHPSPSNPVVVRWTSPIEGIVRVAGRVADADPVGGDGVIADLEYSAADHSLKSVTTTIPNGGKAEIGPSRAAELASIAVRPGETIRLLIRPNANHSFDMTTVDLRVEAVDGSASWDLARDVLPAFLDVHRPTDPGPWSFGEWRPPASSTPESSAAIAAWRAEVGDGADRPAIEQASTTLGLALTAEDARSPFRIADPADESALPADSRVEIAREVAVASALKANPPPPLAFANSASDGGVPGSPHAGTHDVKIHIRGRYDRLGETVPRHVPSVIAGDDPPKIAGGSGRVELARWLTSPGNPLTARVFVNRVWQHHFGEGIVRTPGNFGRLGETPSNPDLLDWLAARFVRDGWSIKALHRLILLSSAYRQSSTPSADALRIDPENRLVSRMNRLRLESEPIRDSLLSASGRLDTTPGGPSIRDLSSPRRSVYLMMIRSTPYPFAPLFDSADPTALVDRRTSSTVAPQALYLLNNEFVIEQARGMARRLLDAGPIDDRARIALAYSLLYSRPPTEEETSIGLSGIGDGGERGWAAYCQVLLCANEFLYID